MYKPVKEISGEITSDLKAFMVTCIHNESGIIMNDHDGSKAPTYYYCVQCVEKFLIKKTLKEKIKFNKGYYGKTGKSGLENAGDK